MTSTKKNKALDKEFLNTLKDIARVRDLRNHLAKFFKDYQPTRIEYKDWIRSLPSLIMDLTDYLNEQSHKTKKKKRIGAKKHAIYY